MELKFTCQQTIIPVRPVLRTCYVYSTRERKGERSFAETGARQFACDRVDCLSAHSELAGKPIGVRFGVLRSFLCGVEETRHVRWPTLARQRIGIGILFSVGISELMSFSKDVCGEEFESLSCFLGFHGFVDYQVHHNSQIIRTRLP